MNVARKLVVITAGLFGMIATFAALLLRRKQKGNREHSKLDLIIEDLGTDTFAGWRGNTSDKNTLPNPPYWSMVAAMDDDGGNWLGDDDDFTFEEIGDDDDDFTFEEIGDDDDDFTFEEIGDDD